MHATPWLEDGVTSVAIWPTLVEWSAANHASRCKFAHRHTYAESPIFRGCENENGVALHEKEAKPSPAFQSEKEVRDSQSHFKSIVHDTASLVERQHATVRSIISRASSDDNRPEGLQRSNTPLSKVRLQFCPCDCGEEAFRTKPPLVLSPESFRDEGFREEDSRGKWGTSDIMVPCSAACYDPDLRSGLPERYSKADLFSVSAIHSASPKPVTTTFNAQQVLEGQRLPSVSSEAKTEGATAFSHVCNDIDENTNTKADIPYSHKVSAEACDPGCTLNFEQEHDCLQPISSKKLTAETPNSIRNGGKSCSADAAKNNEEEIEAQGATKDEPAGTMPPENGDIAKHRTRGLHRIWRILCGKVPEPGLKKLIPLCVSSSNNDPPTRLLTMTSFPTAAPLALRNRANRLRSAFGRSVHSADTIGTAPSDFGSRSVKARRGYVIKSYVDGSVYEGHMVNGKREGAGALFLASNSVFVGQWRDDVREGRGILLEGGSIRYEGEWFAGYRHGRGVLVSRPEGVFLGHFAWNYRHGPGIAIAPDGSIRYERWQGGVRLVSKELREVLEREHRARNLAVLMSRGEPEDKCDSFEQEATTEAGTSRTASFSLWKNRQQSIQSKNSALRSVRRRAVSQQSFDSSLSKLRTNSYTSKVGGELRPSLHPLQEGKVVCFSPPIISRPSRRVSESDYTVTRLRSDEDHGSLSQQSHLAASANDVNGHPKRCTKRFIGTCPTAASGDTIPALNAVANAALDVLKRGEKNRLLSLKSNASIMLHTSSSVSGVYRHSEATDAAVEFEGTEASLFDSNMSGLGKENQSDASECFTEISSFRNKISLRSTSSQGTRTPEVNFDYFKSVGNSDKGSADLSCIPAIDIQQRATRSFYRAFAAQSACAWNGASDTGDVYSASRIDSRECPQSEVAFERYFSNKSLDSFEGSEITFFPRRNVVPRGKMPPLECWTSADVGFLLKYTGLAHLQPLFERRDVTGPVLLRLTEKDLQKDYLLSDPTERQFVLQLAQLLLKSEAKRRLSFLPWGAFLAHLRLMFKDWLIPPSSLRRLHIIGRGGYGVVHRGTWNQRLPVAIKSFGELSPAYLYAAACRATANRNLASCALLSPVLETPRQTKTRLRICQILLDMATEAHILMRLRHPNITKMWGVCIASTRQWLVTDFVPGGSLFHKLHRGHGTSVPEKLSLPEVCRIAYGICAGMAYLHDNNVLHCDLKSPNVLLDSRTGEARICDFGLALSNFAVPAALRGRFGTVQWMAPEVLRGAEITKAADVYSFGVILCTPLCMFCREMVTGRTPHAGMPPNYIVACAGWLAQRRFHAPQKVPRSLADIITSCTQPDPENRPTFDQLLKIFKPILTKITAETSSTTGKILRGVKGAFYAVDAALFGPPI